MELTMEWAYLKENPNTIFRIHIVNSNNIVEYYLPYDVEKRHSARIEQICFIDSQDVPQDIKEWYNDSLFLIDAIIQSRYILLVENIWDV